MSGLSDTAAKDLPQISIDMYETRVVAGLNKSSLNGIYVFVSMLTSGVHVMFDATVSTATIELVFVHWKHTRLPGNKLWFSVA